MLLLQLISFPCRHPNVWRNKQKEKGMSECSLMWSVVRLAGTSLDPVNAKTMDRIRMAV